MYFVMIAGKSMKDPQAHIYVFGPPAMTKEAYASAEHHYRRDYKKKSSDHVMVMKIHESETEEEMLEFLDKLNELMRETRTDASA